MSRRSLLRAAVGAAIALLALAPSTGLASGAASGAGSPARAASSVGYDISWPQCGARYPANPAFGIVGVNKGIVFSANPCLASEITWAGGVKASLYANTGDPGPALSSHWPIGQTSPRACSASSPDTADCAYDYGYDAAQDSFADAASAWSSLRLAGSPGGSAWWLDVETSNSWRTDDLSLNVAALSGAVDYLVNAAGVASVGFYSTSYQWGVITGGTAIFSDHPSWVAGASSARAAAATCGTSGFTGGRVQLAQYLSKGFDADVAC